MSWTLVALNELFRLSPQSLHKICLALSFFSSPSPAFTASASVSICNCHPNTHTHTHTTLYRFPFCVFPVSSVSPSTLSVSSPRCHTPIYLVYMSASAPSFWRPFLLLAVKPCLIPLWTFSSSPIINYFFLLFFSYMSPPPLPLARFLSWVMLKMFSSVFGSIQVNLDHLRALHRASQEVRVSTNTHIHMHTKSP